MLHINIFFPAVFEDHLVLLSFCIINVIFCAIYAPSTLVPYDIDRMGCPYDRHAPRNQLCPFPWSLAGGQ